MQTFPPGIQNPASLDFVTWFRRLIYLGYYSTPYTVTLTITGRSFRSIQNSSVAEPRSTPSQPLVRWLMSQDVTRVADDVDIGLAIHHVPVRSNYGASAVPNLAAPCTARVDCVTLCLELFAVLNV